MEGKNKRTGIVSLFILGVISLLTQILLLRELLASFGGNELILGIFFSFWMILTAFGSFIGRYHIVKSERLLTSLYIFLLAVLLTSLYILPHFLGLFVYTGETISFQSVIILISVILFLPCTILGYLFPHLTSLITPDSGRIGRAYGLEAMGMVAGAIIFTLLLLIFKDTTQAWILLLLLLIVTGISINRSGHKLFKIVGLVLITGIIMLFYFANPVERSFRLLVPGTLLKGSVESPYGRTQIVEDNKQISVIKDRNPVFSLGDVIYSEEPVHLGMSFAKNKENILIISSGNPEVIFEAVKYQPGRIDYLEIDPYSHELILKYLDKDPDQANFISGDPITYLRQSSTIYDLILVLTPNPVSASLNRYYTIEFFKLLRQHLGKNGVLQVTLSSENNYLGDYALALHSSLKSTLFELFNYVAIVPLSDNYFIASNDKPVIDLFHGTVEGNIQTKYYNETYISEELVKIRAEAIERSLDSNSPVNSVYLPANYYLQINEWLSLFNFNINYILIPALILILFIFITMHPLQLGIFTGGLNLSAMQFLFLISFQILYGQIYLLTAAFVGIFMAGLAAGGIYSSKRTGSRKINSFFIAIGISGFIAVLFPLFFKAIISLEMVPVSLAYTAYFLLVFISGITMGIIFSTGSGLMQKDVRKVSSSNYSADLLGAAFGSLFVSIFLFPLTGLQNSAFILASVTFLVLGLIIIRRKKMLTL